MTAAKRAAAPTPKKPATRPRSPRRRPRRRSAAKRTVSGQGGSGEEAPPPSARPPRKADRDHHQGGRAEEARPRSRPAKRPAATARAAATAAKKSAAAPQKPRRRRRGREGAAPARTEAADRRSLRQGGQVPRRATGAAPRGTVHLQRPGRRPAGRGRLAGPRARARRRPVRRGVGRGRHGHGRPGAQPGALGPGLGSRRGDRRCPPQDRAQDLRGVRAVLPGHPQGPPPGPALRPAVRGLQERWPVTTLTGEPAVAEPMPTRGRRPAAARWRSPGGGRGRPRPTSSPNGGRSNVCPRARSTSSGTLDLELSPQHRARRSACSRGTPSLVPWRWSWWPSCWSWRGGRPRRPGRRAGAHPRWCAGQSLRPALPGRPRRGGRLRRPPLLAHLQRGRRLHHGRLCPVAGLVAPGTPAAVSTVVSVDGAGLARRRPGGQGGGPGGRPVPVRGERLIERGTGHRRRDRGHAAGAPPCRRARSSVVDRAERPPGRARTATRRSRSRWSTRTTRSSWWTSRPAWSSTRGPATGPAPWSTVCWPAIPSCGRGRRRWGRTPTVRASCTGWTGAPRACMVVARTPDAYQSLVAQLATRQVCRHYRALVLGTVEGESGLVDAPVGRSVELADPDGRVAARARRPGPATGSRSGSPAGPHHAGDGHPGDGADPPDPGPPVGHRPPGGGGRGLRPGPLAPRGELTRPFLHAYSLALDHPGTGRAGDLVVASCPTTCARQLAPSGLNDRVTR